MSIADAAAAIADDELGALFAAFPRSGGVILAVSGGADSTALLVLARRWRLCLPRGPELVAATVDHGLRAGSRGEAEAVGRLATRLGVPHELLVWQGSKPKTGIEAAARRARHGLLSELAQRLGAAHVATAHTLDDQAETVLMRLAAGSGPAGLAGMRRSEARHGLTLLRPFLALRKQRLRATLERDGIAWIEDPMNADLGFARPRLRAAQAVLAREGLTAERVARLAERIARYEEAVAAGAKAARAGLLHPDRPGRLDGGALFALPEELALRALAAEIAAVGVPPHDCAAKPLRLQRLEALWNDLRQAFDAGHACRRTLAGALIAVDLDRSVRITPAPPRRLRPPRERTLHDIPPKALFTKQR